MPTCAECKHLKTDTPIARKTAALGFSVCAKGVVAGGGLDYWPIEFWHECETFSKLTGEKLIDRKKKLTHWTNYLLKTMGKA